MGQGKSQRKSQSVRRRQRKNERKANTSQKTTEKLKRGDQERGRIPTHMPIKNQFIDYMTNISHNNCQIWSKWLSSIGQMYLLYEWIWARESYLPLDIVVVVAKVTVVFTQLAIGQVQNVICCSSCGRTWPTMTAIL